MTNQSTKDRGIPDKFPKTDFTICYLPSESIFKSKHEKTVQMETDFSAAKTINPNSDFLGPRNYKATAMHHGKWEWVFKYACPVWNPYLVKHTKAIEAIQTRASQLICGPVKGYAERLLELKRESLELGRKYLSLVQMYKIVFGYCDFNCHHYFDIIGITRTWSKDEYKIRPKVARANYFKYSLNHRYINDWNSLPSNVMSSPSLQSFKASLTKYLRS